MTSLFTNVPLDYTIDVILRKIYKDKLIKRKFNKYEMKIFLQLCTKELFKKPSIEERNRQNKAPNGSDGMKTST